MKTKEEVLKDYPFHHHYDYQGYQRDSITHDDAVRAMEEYASQFKQKWISVEDELPGRGTYLFYDNEDCITIWYSPGISKEKWEEKNRLEYRFTHWMPLPENPTT